MTTYKSPPVSCIYCKEVKSAKGIFTHYLISHTIEGKQKNTEKLNKASYLGGATQIHQRLNNITKYNTAPKQCQHCQTNLDYDSRYNKFCSHSCSASASVGKKSIKPRKISSLKGQKKPQTVCKISFCAVCNSLIKNKYVKTCSAECKSKLLSDKIIERIITPRYG